MNPQDDNFFNRAKIKSAKSCIILNNNQSNSKYQDNDFKVIFLRNQIIRENPDINIIIEFSQTQNL